MELLNELNLPAPFQLQPQTWCLSRQQPCLLRANTECLIRPEPTSLVCNEKFSGLSTTNLVPLLSARELPTLSLMKRIEIDGAY